MCDTSPATYEYESTHHVWVFGYFGNQLGPCDVISGGGTEGKGEAAERQQEPRDTKGR